MRSRFLRNRKTSVFSFFFSIIPEENMPLAMTNEEVNDDDDDEDDDSNDEDKDEGDDFAVDVDVS